MLVVREKKSTRGCVLPEHWGSLCPGGRNMDDEISDSWEDPAEGGVRDRTVVGTRYLQTLGDLGNTLGKHSSHQGARAA